MKTVSYHLAAYCPDPRGGNNNFTYDDTVDVAANLKPALVRGEVVNALADHIEAKTGVRVDAQYVVVQLLEKVDPAGQE